MPQFLQPDGPTYICSAKQDGACHSTSCPFGRERRCRDNLGPLRCTLVQPPVPGGVMVDEAIHTPAPVAPGKAGAA